MKSRGFTLIEMLVVIAIISVLSYIVVVGLAKSRSRAKLSRVSTELSGIAKSFSQYADDNGYAYPPDTGRGVPPGLERYLAGGVWPQGAWPNGVYDYDNWTIDGSAVYQISYRLCDTDDPDSYCRDPILFPNFTRYSAIFYCISGPCVPHQSHPEAPAYAVNWKNHEVNPPL